jgi:photosystem II PsbY protein
MEFDWRILIVLTPVLLAGGWAAYNVGTIALKQVQKLLNKQT